jgi:hypothetical protein
MRRYSYQIDPNARFGQRTLFKPAAPPQSATIALDPVRRFLLLLGAAFTFGLAIPPAWPHVLEIAAYLAR